MKKGLILSYKIIFFLTFFLVILNSIARGEGLQGKWAMGLKLGPSFLVEELSDNTEGELGLIVNGNLSYGFTERFLVGLHLEWERHNVKDRTIDITYGDETNLSIIPVVEFHPRAGSPFSPYGLLGLGININSFRGSSDLNSLCAPSACKMEPNNTLALKGGLGVDYFISPALAYNMELDLKMNDGQSDITGNFAGFTSGTSVDNRACSLSLNLGIRYYF